MIQHHPLAATILVGMVAILVLAAWRPLVKWLRKVRRRRGGVYLWRVDRWPGRGRVNGYVGETTSFYHRRRQHLGLDRERGVPRQPWSDLNPVCYQVIKLPWWLCWKWVLRPLETLVMLVTWPVYNRAKNTWNPRRVELSIAKAQRATRDVRRMVRR